MQVNIQFGEDAIEGRTGTARDRKHDPNGLPTQRRHNRRRRCHVLVYLLVDVRARTNSAFVSELLALVFSFSCLGHLDNTEAGEITLFSFRE